VANKRQPSHRGRNMSSSQYQNPPRRHYLNDNAACCVYSDSASEKTRPNDRTVINKGKRGWCPSAAKSDLEGTSVESRHSAAKLQFFHRLIDLRTHSQDVAAPAMQIFQQQFRRRTVPAISRQAIRSTDRSHQFIAEIAKNILHNLQMCIPVLH
jgi:hypothetical protein